VDLGLRGKTAMVAGASRGLGFAVAKNLSAEGVRVSICSRDADAVAKAVHDLNASGTDMAYGMAVDLRSRTQIEDWHNATVRHLGPVDLLFANTGGPEVGTAGSMSDEQWEQAFELLFLSVVRLVRLVIPGMAARRSGAIVVLTSSAVKEPIPNLALSNAVRSAVSALTKTLANELALSGIRVNQLMPGRIATQRVQQLDEANSKRRGTPLAEHRRQMEANIPVGRYGDPDELARAALFLFSDMSTYITGATLQVDGGLIRSVI
jgi:3-oxoacyl-[acyl-carrier protein] reductase